MSPRFTTVRTALLILALAACAPGTKLVNSWKAADAAPLPLKQGDLVIAMVMSKEETTRRTGEDLLGEELRRADSAPFRRSPSSPPTRSMTGRRPPPPSRTRAPWRSSRCVPSR